MKYLLNRILNNSTDYNPPPELKNLKNNLSKTKISSEEQNRNYALILNGRWDFRRNRYE